MKKLKNGPNGLRKKMMYPQIQQMKVFLLRVSKGLSINILTQFLNQDCFRDVLTGITNTLLTMKRI